MAAIVGSTLSVSSSEAVRYEIPQSPINDKGSNEIVESETPPANVRSSVSSSGSVKYKIPQSPTSSSGYEVPQSSAAIITGCPYRNSCYSSSTAEYEEPQPSEEITANRSSCCSSNTVEYEVPQFTRQCRESSTSSRGRDLLFTGNRRSLRALPSTASHQSQFLSKSSGLQLLGRHTPKRRPAEKRVALLSNDACKVGSALCGIILIGVTALVLGILVVKGVLCQGEISCSLKNKERGKMIRRQFTSLQKQVQEMQNSVFNSTTLSDIDNVTDVTMNNECKMLSGSCTLLPIPQNYTYSNPLCKTPQLRINRKGFYPIGVHCSIKSKGLNDQDNNIELDSPFNRIITREVMSSGRASCQCYLPLVTYQLPRVDEMKCVITVIVCPLLTLNITTTLRPV